MELNSVWHIFAALKIDGWMETGRWHQPFFRRYMSFAHLWAIQQYLVHTPFSQ